ncbi:MAG TPA: hypothetical protein VNK41_00395 [Vicinamibacterales bacterium]|nr:hypothetical protein [Vicinamibacterales bacterium]
MDVFLIPVGSDRYELYCEVPEDDPARGEDASSRRPYFRMLFARFREMLAEAERERHHGSAPRADETSLYRRIKRRALCRIAEAIAEQRLLWHLRKQQQATLVHPDDLDPLRADALVRTQLRADYDKHRRWLIVDAVLLVLSGALVIVPGPNLIAYYLAFRVVGHYLSLRGARQGLERVRWVPRPSQPLSELRQAIGLAPEQRAARVSDVAARLHLERLVWFFQRTAISPGVRS